MENFSPEPVNTLKAEHLKEGVLPIIACVGTIDQYEGEMFQINEIKRTGHDVDYFADSERLSQQNFRNAGEQTYVISTIDARSKFTEKLYECTSLVAVGIDINNNKRNLSFLTHQEPSSFLIADRMEFMASLKNRLYELKSACLPGTVDIVIAGGRIPDLYGESIKTLCSLVETVFGFEPVVIAGPKKENGACDNIYFDNDQRRLYIIRPGDDKKFEAVYSAGEAKDREKKWRSDLWSEQLERENDK